MVAAAFWQRLPLAATSISTENPVITIDQTAPDHVSADRYFRLRVATVGN